MVPISPEIYSSTAVVMDNRGLSDYILKLEDRRVKRAAAEKDAISAFLKDNEKNLDPAGMRATDVPQFEKGLNTFRQTSLDVMQNPNNFKKRLQVQQEADALRAFVAKSKQAKEEGKGYDNLFLEITKNPDLRKSISFNTLLKDKANHDLPIGFQGVPALGIPARQDKEFNPNYYKPAPVSIVDLFEKNKQGIDLGAPKKVSETDKDFYYVTEQSYNPEDNKNIALRIADRVATDPNLKDSFEVKGQNYEPAELARLNTIVKKYFPDLEVDDEDPISIAIAESLEEGERRKKQTRVLDRNAEARYRSSLISGRQAQQQAATGNVLDEFPDVPITRKTITGDVPLGSIQGGAVYDNKGNLFTGTFRTAYEQLPAGLPAVLGFAKIKMSKAPATIKVVNGRIESIKQDKMPEINRQIIENAQRKFGKGGQFGVEPSSFNINDPLDLGID